jgi:hypothetical protein
MDLRTIEWSPLKIMIKCSFNLTLKVVCKTEFGELSKKIQVYITFNGSGKKMFDTIRHSHPLVSQNNITHDIL